jgi:hypothetical protein
LKKLPNPSLSIRLLYAVCLSGAAWNHARDVAAHGLHWDHGGAPAFVSAFWTTLTFLDPLAVVLLVLLPKPGLALTVAIIVADVVINGWMGITHGFDTAAFMAQALFLALVLGTVRSAWRAAAPFVQWQSEAR